MSQNFTTVILTHGAWADGSSWSKVILPPERQGLRVIAAPIPLTSLSNDIAALGRAIERTNGPVILAAHACAGAVISATSDGRVKSLVYVAALTPDEGETVGDVFYRGKPHPKAPQLAPDADGLIWMPEAGFGDVRAECPCRDDCHSGCHAAADCFAMYSRDRAEACLENEALVVPGGGRRPNDQSRDAVFHGGTNGREGSHARRRSHAVGHRAGAGRGCHPRSRCRYDV
jgi:pimeloyl-ACP methyl ester carboxylesterase